MPIEELSEEDVMNDDKDPLEAIREIRKQEGVPEDELPDPDARPISDSSDLIERQQEDEDGQEEDDETKTSESASDDSESSASVAGSDQEGEVDGADKEDSSQDQAADGDEADSSQSASDSEDKEKEAGAEKDTGPVSRKFRANGQEFEFSQEEILEQFETVFGQAMNYTQKMQKIAPYRKMISALEQEGVTHDSLNLALDALKGDKGAIKKLLEQNQLDAYDLTSDDESSDTYTPKDYGKNETQLEIEEITGMIQGDKEFAITTNVIDEQWDSSSRQAIAANPNMIVGLHNDIKSGLYDKVAPMAMKMKVLDGNTKSDIEYYMLAGQRFAQEAEQQAKTQESQKTVDELNAEAQGAESKFDKASSEASRKRSASSTGARADRKGVIDYLDDDDEAFEEWYKNLHSSI